MDTPLLHKKINWSASLLTFRLIISDVSITSLVSIISMKNRIVMRESCSSSVGIFLVSYMTLALSDFGTFLYLYFHLLISLLSSRNGYLFQGKPRPWGSPTLVIGILLVGGMECAYAIAIRKMVLNWRILRTLNNFLPLLKSLCAFTTVILTFFMDADMVICLILVQHLGCWQSVILDTLGYWQRDSYWQRRECFMKL